MGLSLASGYDLCISAPTARQDSLCGFTLAFPGDLVVCSKAKQYVEECSRGEGEIEGFVVRVVYSAHTVASDWIVYVVSRFG